MNHAAVGARSPADLGGNDGAYVKRPSFLKWVPGAGVTVISRLRCDAALWSLPPVVDPGQKKGRGRPPKYGKDRIDLAKTGPAPQYLGLADRAFLPLRPAGGEEVQDVPGDLQTGGGVIRVVLVREPIAGWRTSRPTRI